MIDSNAATDPIRTRTAYQSQAAVGKIGRASSLLCLLKARLMIFLYRHPLDNYEHIMDVIDNTESTGEIKLLLDYVLARRMRQRGMQWDDGATAG